MIYIGAVKRHPYVLIALSGLLVCGAVWGVLGNKVPAENAAPARIKVAVATFNSTPFTYYLDTIFTVHYQQYHYAIILRRFLIPRTTAEAKE